MAPTLKPTADDLDQRILHGMAKPRPHLRDLAAAEKRTGGRKIVMLTCDQMATSPPARSRIKRVLLAESLAAIFGPSGSSKTFYAFGMAFVLSDGGEFFGYRVEPCDVLYVALEGEAGLAQRVKAYRARHGEAAGARLRFITAPVSLLYTDDVDALLEAIKAADIKGGVIFIDTLNAATPGMDENQSADMGRAIAAVKRIRDEFGGAVVLVHHAGKDATRGMRGHSSLHAALDTVIEVTRDGDRRSWRLAKSKDGADGIEHPFRLEVVDVGTDDDGDPVTSCVVVADEDAQTATRSKLPKGGNQRIVYDALGELLRKSVDFGKAGAPATRPCVDLEAAVEFIAPRLAVEDRRKVERTRQALTGLIAGNVVICRSGWLWLP